MVACTGSSFLSRLDNIPLYRETTFYLFIYQCVDSEVVFAFCLLSNAAVNIPAQVFLGTCSHFSRGNYLGVELLDHVVTLCVTF